MSRPRVQSGPVISTFLCFVVSAATMAAALWYVQRGGWTLWYGDAEAHLNVARRVVDSRTPGWYQIGTVWLPLPHLLMLPLVRDDRMWTTGLAGAIPAAVTMTLAATFLFAALRRLFGAPAAAAGTAVFLFNPNVLYLGSIPMTEPVFFASLCALLYFTVRFAATQGWGALIGAAIAALAGTLTRYEGWALLPFVALYLLVAGPRARWKKRLAAAIVFSLIASIGPVGWLLHNRWYFGDALEFYRGPYSAIAIKGAEPYPGRGDWPTAIRYFFAAGRLVAGWPALLLGGAGLVVALFRKAWWPILLLALPAGFYILSVHSSGVPIFVPTLWPFSYYNTRYATALLPLTGLGIAAMAGLTRYSRSVATAAVLIALSPFALHRASPVTWKESDINSKARRAWTEGAAEYLRANVGPGDGIFTVFGDMTGIFRSAGIPLRRTLTANNVVEWAEATARPEWFLREEWVVTTSGSEIQTMIDRLRRHAPRYELEERIMVKDAPVVEIYRRAPDPVPEEAHDNPVP